jgi:pimeloyl-ACP methyl ester carboxylesterase
MTELPRRFVVSAFAIVSAFALALSQVVPLTAPTQTLELPDGRKLAWIEVGAAEGHPVFFFHGGADSRLEALLIDDEAKAVGVRLIAPDRPGFGASSPLADRTFNAWSRDVGALADHLGIERFDVVGHSGGGPHALVVAHDLPARVGRVAVVAGAAPREAGAAGMVIPFRAGRFFSIYVPWVHRKMLDGHRESLADPDAFLAQYADVSPGDGALWKARPELGRLLVADMVEGYRQGTDAAWHEAQLYYGEWGFELGSIRQPVRLEYSKADPNTAPAWGSYLRDRLPAAELVMHEHDGHISVLVNRAESVFAWLRQMERQRPAPTPAATPAEPATRDE